MSFKTGNLKTTCGNIRNNVYFLRFYANSTLQLTALFNELFYTERKLS
jgi:hypothetical protein